MQGFSLNSTISLNTSFVQIASSLGVFSIQEFNDWKNLKEAEEQGKTQELITTTHTDNHANHPNHVNSGGGHSNNHSNGQVITGHLDGPLDSSGHINQTTPAYSELFGDDMHINTPGGHTDSYSDAGHADHTYYGHGDTGYSQNIPHQQSGHNNSTHNDIGFDHQEYVPSQPHLFEGDEIIDSKLLRGTTTIGMYSYDKNNEGDGSQDIQSKTVKYYIKIRKVKDLNGTNNVSSWTNLINNSTNDTYELNTIDPLGTGNTNEKLTEGFYEIEAWAANDPRSEKGVSKTYESEHKIVTVRIQQNIEPEITVENGNEFIDFVFGPIGATDGPDGTFTAYEDGLYSEAPSDKREGIFVAVTMRDADKTPFEQWQKGKVYLEDQGGTKQAGTEVSIIWENGSEIISSSDTNKKGYAFIHTSNYGTTLENAKLIVEVSDYEDNACAQPTGTTVKQQTISKSDLTELNFHIDLSAPALNSFSMTVLNQQEIKANLEIKDMPDSVNHSGIPTSPYKYRIIGKKLDSTWEITKDWNIDWVEGTATNEETFSGLQANRQYEIDIKATDKVGNIYSSDGDGSFTNNIKYTYALPPSDVNISEVGNTDVTVDITTDTNNYELPEYRVIAVPTDGSGNPVYNSTDVIVGAWSSSTNQKIEGLKEETEYLLLVDTRNGDNLSLYTNGDIPTSEELENIKNDVPSDSGINNPIFTNRSPIMSGISANKDTLSSISGYSFLGDSLENNALISFSGGISDKDAGDKIKMYYSFDIDVFDTNMPTVGEEVTSTGEGWIGDPFASNNTIDVGNLPTTDKTVAPAEQLDGTRLKDGVHTLRLWAIDHRGAVSETPTEITINIDNTSPNIIDTVAIDTSALTKTSHKINLPRAEDVSAGTVAFVTSIADNAFKISKQLDDQVFEAVTSDWIAYSETEYTIDSLKANGPYKFKVEVRDKLNNISEAISDTKYTYALLPKGSNIEKIDNTAITIEIIPNEENYKDPEYRLIAIPTDDDENPIFDSSNVVIGDWSLDTTQTISGLQEETTYLIIIDVKNGDGISQYTGDNSTSSTIPTSDQLENLKDKNDSEMDDSETNTPLHTNRKPQIIEFAVSDGLHHKGRPLEVKLTTRELDAKDKLKVFYKIEGLPGYTKNQIERPELIDGGYNYEHDTPYEEYTGYIDLTSSVAGGAYDIEVWVQDAAGKKSESKAEMFKVSQEAYYLDDIKNIAEDGTDDELKDAIKNIIGDEFDDLYYPEPIPSNMSETEYLDLVRDEILDLTGDIEAEDIKEILALVNINVKLSIDEEDTITDKEIKLVLNDNSNLYNSSYLKDYQNELGRFYDNGGEGIMRLDSKDILLAIKFVNLKKNIDSVTAADIREITENDPPIYDDYIDSYKGSIKKLDNPTIEEFEEAIKLVNINRKIEDGTITANDLKVLLADTQITLSYLSDYIKYLQMYQDDLGRDLVKNEIKQVIESVNAVKEYEDSNTDSNQSKAKNKVNILVNGDTKEELLSRTTQLENPEIKLSYDISGDKDLATISSLSELKSSSKESFVKFLEGKINQITVNYRDNKTILIREGKTKVTIANLQGTEYRFIEKTGLSSESQDWQQIEDDKIEENLSFSQQGYFSGGIQVKNAVGTTSDTTNIDFIVDWENPTGEIEKYIPMQSATEDDSIKIKLDVKDNLNTRKFAKINGTWDVMNDDYFDYSLSGDAGLKVIEIEVSDICGNKKTLKDTIWKIENE